MCNQETGTFYHLIWRCPRVQGYCTQVVQFLYDIMGSPLTLHPEPCLLGIYPEPEMNKFTKIFLNETLFSERKVLARQWMRTDSAEFSTWVAEVNNSLPYKTYKHRGCPSKFNKIWDRWLQAAETLS